MKKIEKLTPAQEKALVDTREKWLRIGRSTERINRPKAEAAISAMYAEIGKKPPVFMHFTNPLFCQLAANIFQLISKQPTTKKPLSTPLSGQLGDQLRNQLRDQLSDQLRNQLWDQLSDQLSAQLWGQLSDQLWDQLRDQLGDQLRDQLWDQLSATLRNQLSDQLSVRIWDQLWNQLRAPFGDQLGDQLSGQLGDQLSNKFEYIPMFYGSLECYWEVWHKFGTQIGVKRTKKQNRILDLWCAQGEACFSWLPFENVCFVSDRPTEINLDERGRLHSLTDYSMKFADGWGFCSLWGVRVPEKYVIESVNPDELLKEPNAEIRMVVIRKEGFDKIISKLKATCISTAPSTRGHPEPCALYDVLVPDVGETRLLRLTWLDANDTMKETFIPVPRTRNEFTNVSGTHSVPKNVDDCEQVRRWSMGLSPDDEVIIET